VDDTRDLNMVNSVVVAVYLVVFFKFSGDLQN